MGAVSEPRDDRFEPQYEPSFAECRARLNLSGAPFDHFFADVEDAFCKDPYFASETVPEAQGIRIRPTRESFPDLPPLYVHYRIKRDPNRIVFFGLSRAWSNPGETLPPL